MYTHNASHIKWTFGKKISLGEEYLPLAYNNTRATFWNQCPVPARSKHPLRTLWGMSIKLTSTKNISSMTLEAFGKTNLYE